MMLVCLMKLQQDHTIAFDDKIVKYLPDFKLVVNKAIIPSEEEIENNPRARSSKLRVIERIK